MSTQYDVAGAASQFQIRGTFVSATPHGNGHINDTWCVVSNDSGSTQRSILQRINHRVFRNPVAVMENIERVTTHLAARVSGDPDRDRRVLALIPARDGRVWHHDAGGNFWRAYRFIENATSCDAVQFEAQAFQAAKAFGNFQRLLIDLPAPRLHTTIPDFHNTVKRFEALEKAIAEDPADRARLAGSEIAFALARQSICGILLDADLPERITHNDTKLGNVLLDDATGEGICVIDLDTVMPGLALYDFGDMVRTTTSPAREDERDLPKVTMQFPMFEALLRGYLSSAGDFLTTAEREFLAFSGKLITFEMGLRFLADFLQGDVYYKVHREAHNLDRCRTQFKLVESIEQQQARMERLVWSVSRGSA